MSTNMHLYDNLDKNIKGKKAKLSWKKLAGATGYTVQYATNKTFKKAN